MNKKDILANCYNILKRAGFFPRNNVIKHIGYVYGYITTIIFILSFIGLYKNPRKGPIIESLVSLFQIYAKTFTLWVYKAELERTIWEMNKFWDITIISTKIKQEPLYKLNRYVNTLLKVYWGVILSNLVLFCTKFLITKDQEMPLACYVPDNFVLNFYSVYIMMVLWLLPTSQLVIGFDIMYVVFCAKVYTQLKILQDQFTVIDFEDGPLLLRMVKHHKFVVRLV